MNLFDLFEGVTAAGYDNIKRILTAVQNKTPATIQLTNGDEVEVDYTEARWLAGKFRAFQKVGRQEEFMMDVEDPVRLDAHMRQLRSLIDKQKDFRGSVVGQRDIPGETDKPYEKTLGEQSYEGSPRAIGIAHVGLIDKKKDSDEPVTISFGPNGPAWDIPGRINKKWFLNVWQSYKRVGREEQFLELMGTPEGFKKILVRYVRDKAKAQRDTLLGTQKKSPENESVNELDNNAKKDDDVVNARTQRMLRQLRIQNPQAQSDLEALAYSFIDGQRKDREDIEKLEKETDNIEQNVKNDLQKRINTITAQRGRITDRLNQVQNTNKDQDNLLNQLSQIDRQQQQALDALKKTTQGKDEQPAQSAVANLPDTGIGSPTTATAPETQPKKQVKRAPAKSAPTLSIIDKDDEEADRAQMSLPLGGRPTRQKPKLSVVPVNIAGPEEQPEEQPVEPIGAEIAAEPDVKVKVAESDKDDLRKQLDRYTQLALQANRAGDDEKCKMYQRKMNAVKDKMSKQITDESLGQGEYHIATVTLDNGEKRKFKVTYDEGYTDTIKNFYAKQGRKVVDIDMDFAVHGDNFNEDLYNQGVNEAQKKFPRASAEMIHEWASKWAKAHGGILNENKETYVLYVNNKPAAKYQQEHDALRDIEHLKKNRPEAVIDLKREVCDLETIKHVAESQSMFEDQFDHVANTRLRRILVSGAKSLADVDWAMDFTYNALMADYDDQMIPSSVYDARNKAYGSAEESFDEGEGDLDATLAHLKQFWSV
jgi:hypothetical protein